MSAFKRYQSKVFWDRMAAHDLGDDPFVARNNTPYCCRDEHEKPTENEHENSSGKSENDTIECANVTAIRVCDKSGASPQDERWISSTHEENAACSRTQGEEMAEEEEEQKRDSVARNRSCSPLSQDFRSQDSGFSDSERSDCSEPYATPKRKLRRKKRRSRVQLTGIVSTPCWPESPPVPTHTSTPKNSRILVPRNRPGKPRRSPQRGQRTDEERSNASKAPSTVSLEDESLGDFLYASEPPEDSVQPSVAKSQASTDTDAIAAGREVLNSRNYRQSSSLRTWLTDLAAETENECSNMLQSKNLPRGRARLMSGEEQARELKTLSSAATAAASKLLVNAEHFEQYFRSIVKRLTRLERGKSETELLRSIEEAAYSILSQMGAPPPRRIHQGNLRSILAQLRNMKTYVDGTIDARLDFYMEKIIRCLEEAPRKDTSVAKGAMAALTALGLSDPRAGNSMARCSGIKTLLTYLVDADYRTSDDLVSAALRALASACCSTMAIDYFARDGGPEILTDILTAETATETERTEATALVVQITAPWTNAHGLPYLEPFANTLIPALNRLVESTSCVQTLLLSAAALNYLSKSKLCTDIILERDSVRKLLKSVKKSVGGNVWLMEQVAALIGGLARVPEGRSYLAKARASVALVSFLRMRPPGLEDAYRRLEITATAALTRLCVEPEIARQVVAVGGGDCLPGPCRVNDAQSDGEEEETRARTGLLRYTKSLRRACKKAAKQIGIARAKDHSPFG